MKKCSISIKDKEYAIQLNRNSILWLENAGFSIGDFERKPLVTVELLWTAGFVMNYPEISPVDALKLMDEYKDEGGDVSEVAKFVLDEYTNFINALSVTKSKKKATITEI